MHIIPPPLHKLGLISHLLFDGFCKRFGDRAIPPEAAIVLRLLASGKITVADIEAAAAKL